MNNFPPVPPNPKKPKSPYEKHVQLAGIGLGIFFLLLSGGNMYFLTSSLVYLTEVARIFLLVAEYILIFIGSLFIVIFMED